MSNPNWAKGLGRTNINKQLEELDLDMAITLDQYYEARGLLPPEPKRKPKRNRKTIHK